MTASCPKILKALMVVGGGTGEFILFKNHLSLHLISSFGGLRNCHPGNNLHVFLFPFRMSRVCLTLLSAMVAQGPDTARNLNDLQQKKLYFRFRQFIHTAFILWKWSQVFNVIIFQNTSCPLYGFHCFNSLLEI